MIEMTLDANAYAARFAELESGRNGSNPGWLREIRRSAMNRFTEIGFPGMDHEDWRFTNVSPISRQGFIPLGASGEKPAVETLEDLSFGGKDVARLVFLNGRPVPGLSRLDSLPAGVRVESLARALETSPELVQPHLGRHARYENHAFAALNTALMEDGAFIFVPNDTVVASPVHLIFATTAGPEASVSHPRNLIVAGESSQVRVVESYLGLSGVYWTNAVTEIIAGDNAVVDHYKLQREGLDAYHTATLEMIAGRSAVLSNHSISLGAALARNDVRIVMDGEGGDGTINGLYVVGGKQHVDNHTSIDHARPHCSTHELYKGVLDGKARGVFNGRIRVRKGAQKTDSKQTNKNLLLSSEALVNSNPQLEIYADDVKCTHGATIGQLDEAAIFYLRSRGIPREAARHLLTYAFAADLVARIRVEELKASLDHLLIRRLRDEDGPGEAS